MATGYEDIDNFAKQQQSNLKAQETLQDQITDLGTQKTIDKLQYDQAKIDKQTNKTTSGLYTDYQKEVNQYGVQADAQARKGLANSGYAETSRVNLYNTYQKNVTETVNTANQLKADFDFQMAQAMQEGNIAKAQNKLNLYQQQLQLAVQEYEMRQNQKQFLYQQERDRVSDKQWQTNFDYQKSRDKVSDSQWKQSFDYQKSRDAVSDSQWQKSFDYQKSRDAVADSQWQKQYELSKKASASSSRSSRSSGYRRSGGGSRSSSGGLVVNTQDAPKKQPTMTDNGQMLLGSLQKTMASNKGKATEGYARTIAENAVKTAIAKGKISEDDGILIGQKLGI